MRKEEKHLDLELLVFFVSVAVLSFFFYLIRHPLAFSLIEVRDIDLLPFFSAYSFDLIIFLFILVPYIVLIIFLIYFKIMKTIKKIPDNVMIILFFPLLSFFTKGMSLLHIYIDYSLIEILKENFAFFSFLFTGPAIVLAHKAVIKFKKYKRKKDSQLIEGVK